MGNNPFLMILSYFSPFKFGLPVIPSVLISFFLFSAIVNIPHPSHALADFNIAAVGDWGCSSNTDATVTNIMNKSPELVLGLGDYSYQPTATCWFDAIQPIDSITKINIGNHEDDSSESYSSYIDHFNLDTPYYSYNLNNVHILTMDSDRTSYAPGSVQYNFVINDLQSAAQNPDIDWIIVNIHQWIYRSSSSNPVNDDVAEYYHPFFDQYGVDLVLAGHDHKYHRTYPIKYNPSNPLNPIITNNNPNNYNNPQGVIYAVVGTGGINLGSIDGSSPFIASAQDDFFGQLDIRITNDGARLEGRFHRNGNNAILDSFSITKVNSPPVANNQAVTVIKDTPTPITLSATDPDNDALTYSIVQQPLNGAISSGTEAARTYTPTTGYTGPDSFTFKANDGTADSNPATVTINVIELPQGSYNYAPNLVLTGTNHHDEASSSALQLSQFSAASWFKTSSNFASTAYIVNKGGVGSDSAGQNMNYGIWMTSAERIQAGFEAVGGADHFVTSLSKYNDGQWHYAVVTYDGSTVILYIDGVQVGTKSTSGASPESTGTKPVRVGANSRVTPPGNFFTGEVDEVRIWEVALTALQAGDAFAGSSFNIGEQVLYLQFGSNSPPVANNQAVTVIKDTPTPITLSATDPDNDALTYSIVQQPLNGAISSGTEAARTYTPTTGYTGSDSFTFKANDGTADSNPATVTINVIELPQGGYNYAPPFVATGTTYNDTPDSPALRLNQFTLAAWFKTSTNFASEAFIVNKGGIGSDSANQNQNYQISMTSSERIKVGFETSSGADQFVTSPSTYNDGQWHYAVVTNDGPNVILYIDGQPVASKSTAGASPESTGTKPVRVGANSRVTPPGNFFTGEVDEVRIWNNALTALEVSDAFGGVFKPGHALYLDFSSSSSAAYHYDPSLSLSGAH